MERREILENRAVVGIEAVKARYPDWKSRIDLATFDMQLSHTCILGQVCGGFEKGVALLSLKTDAEIVACGFKLSPTELFQGWLEEWKYVWLLAIQAEIAE